MTSLKAAVIPVTPFQQNCTLLSRALTMIPKGLGTPPRDSADSDVSRLPSLG
jgi:hypothetical protein